MRTPTYLVTGLHAEAMITATLRLQLELPEAVVVRHEVRRAEGCLVRTISDLTGVLEREVVPLEHACTSCAVREDILPTIERLAGLARWPVVVSHLPVAADGLAVCRALRRVQSLAPSARVAGVVCAVHGPDALSDLLGDDLVGERLPQECAGDQRGVAELLAAMVEHADRVCVAGEVSDEAEDLLRLLARPGVPLAPDWPGLGHEELLRGVHDHGASERWIAEVPQGPARDAEGSHAWRLELTTRVPLHPQRLREDIGGLGGGRHRSRGCFWLASRPGQVGVWDGAGGQLSIGVTGTWARDRPVTRVLVTGLLEDDVRDDLRAAFADLQLTREELRDRGPYWEVPSDGLETWLGPTPRAA
ncbi:GTP-binding protein [Ornithinimicrobium cavernae]|uniref:GTP-binding protein n=1 Tax=Ornithinimicrobium cavernae TaxID=2666047 RepID=UPI000D69AB20|nr:GTP-binding protein [Ornithinimicrobium cavernae]